MELNLTTILSSVITSAVNGVAMFLSIRYMTKLVDSVEKKMNKKNEQGDEK